MTLKKRKKEFPQPPTKVKNWGGIAKLICMSKVRNFSEIAPNIAFLDFNFYDLYRSTFEKSELEIDLKLLKIIIRFEECN